MLWLPCEQWAPFCSWLLSQGIEKQADSPGMVGLSDLWTKKMRKPMWACPNWVRYCLTGKVFPPSPRFHLRKAGIQLICCIWTVHCCLNWVRTWPYAVAPRLEGQWGFSHPGKPENYINYHLHQGQVIFLLCKNKTKQNKKLWWSKSPRCPQCFAFHLVQYLCDEISTL